MFIATWMTSIAQACHRSWKVYKPQMEKPCCFRVKLHIGGVHIFFGQSDGGLTMTYVPIQPEAIHGFQTSLWLSNQGKLLERKVTWILATVFIVSWQAVSILRSWWYLFDIFSYRERKTWMCMMIWKCMPRCKRRTTTRNALISNLLSFISLVLWDTVNLFCRSDAGGEII